MNDEETVALIAGGHTFGKTHGAGDADLVGPEPEGAPLEEQGLGWLSAFGTGKGADTITSGLEVTWTDHPTQWSNEFFEILFGYEWELDEAPAGANQWVAKDAEARSSPGAARPRRRSASRRCSPPTWRCASTRRTRRSRAASWRTPTSSRWPSPRPGTSCCTATWARSPATSAPGSPSRSCGRTRCRPSTTSWSATPTSPRSRRRCWTPASRSSELVSTAWASAASFRSTDKRGGANGARIRLEPQRSWAVNQPEQLARGAREARGHPARVQRGRRRAGSRWPT